MENRLTVHELPTPLNIAGVTGGLVRLLAIPSIPASQSHLLVGLPSSEAEQQQRDAATRQSKPFRILYSIHTPRHSVANRRAYAKGHSGISEMI